MTRIIDKIQHRRKQHEIETQQGESEKYRKNKKCCLFYSFEFFPPKTEAGMDNLLIRIDRMSHKIMMEDPLFIDITWGAGGSTSARTLSLAGHSQRYLGLDVLMHLTCTDLSKKQLQSILQQAKTNGIQNILALKGDPPKGSVSSGTGSGSGSGSGGVSNTRYGNSRLAHNTSNNSENENECFHRAIDLVKFIRELYGNYFCIAVAGHPEGHPLSSSQDEELFHLKEKIDAGADFIVTQFFYDVTIFLEYVKKCRNVGITCPIIPGIMPIHSYSTFIRMTQFCDITVPQPILDRLKPVKDDDEAVKEIGCDIAKTMSEQILNAPDIDVDAIHFYTLNLERSVTRIMKTMDEFHYSNDKDINASSSEEPSSTSPRRRQVKKYPWKTSALTKRSTQEEVRPINWANRPRSYVVRTDDWDEFPNGRWGDSTSPAFGELSSLSHFYGNLNFGSEDDRRQYLGENPTSLQDVYHVFSKYVSGQIPYLPWCESQLQPESFTIQNQLQQLNQKGFLTINSQPSVNGYASDHPTFGWGGPGGYVYQKAYLECFVHPDKAKWMVDLVTHKYPFMNLYAVNCVGVEMRAPKSYSSSSTLPSNELAKVNTDTHDSVTALTWGVFPNREIIQPTIFDPSTFLVWAEEAFSLWDSVWLNLYEYGSDAFELIDNIKETFFLVAIVDNDFVGDSDLFSALLEMEEVNE